MTNNKGELLIYKGKAVCVLVFRALFFRCGVVLKCAMAKKDAVVVFPGRSGGSGSDSAQFRATLPRRRFCGIIKHNNERTEEYVHCVFVLEAAASVETKKKRRRKKKKQLGGKSKTKKHSKCKPKKQNPALATTHQPKASTVQGKKNPSTRKPCPCTCASQSAGDEMGNSSNVLTHFVASVVVDAFFCEAASSWTAERQQGRQASAGLHTLARYCMAEEGWEQGLRSVDTQENKGFRSRHHHHTGVCHQEVRLCNV